MKGLLWLNVGVPKSASLHFPYDSYCSLAERFLHGTCILRIRTQCPSIGLGFNLSVHYLVSLLGVSTSSPPGVEGFGRVQEIVVLVRVRSCINPRGSCAIIIHYHVSSRLIYFTIALLLALVTQSSPWMFERKCKRDSSAWWPPIYVTVNAHCCRLIPIELKYSHLPFNAGSTTSIWVLFVWNNSLRHCAPPCQASHTGLPEAR